MALMMQQPLWIVQEEKELPLSVSLTGRLLLALVMQPLGREGLLWAVEGEEEPAVALGARLLFLAVMQPQQQREGLLWEVEEEEELAVAPEARLLLLAVMVQPQQRTRSLRGAEDGELTRMVEVLVLS